MPPEQHTQPTPGPPPRPPGARAATVDPIVIVAARNEADRIGDTLAALREAMPAAELFVADDASADATAEVASAHGAAVASGERSRGKGANVTFAAELALAEVPGAGERTFLLCDADLGESAGELAALVESVERGECDLAIAAFARREGGGLGVTVAHARKKIAELSGHRAEAPISGQRAMRAAVLRDLLPFAKGFGMETGMTIDAVRAGYEVKEIELPLQHRATYRTLRGFLHRARQLRDIRRAARARRGGPDQRR